jgi:hypothetical protein
MPTLLGPEYTTDWRGNPPHMLQPDVPVWYRFLNKYAYLTEKLYYDVMLGGPYDIPLHFDAAMVKMSIANLSKRIDALIVSEDKVFIIEVSADPGLRAIGQCMVYRSLFFQDDIFNLPVTLSIVCARIDIDIAWAAGDLGIQIYVV